MHELDLPAGWIELPIRGAIDYRAEDLNAALVRECPGGVDVFFDNVGGQVLDSVLLNLAIGARMRGFVVPEFMGDYPELDAALRSLYLNGKLRYRSHILEGFEQAPEGLRLLFTGENSGKVLVRAASNR